jgi:hypothetical protein
MARYERDWYHAVIVSLEPDGDYLVRWIRPKGVTLTIGLMRVPRFG